ncbi:MarR family winged helix-turn-helix transcriptional regulator [Novosphingobium ginsenosidimutans]|uniref:Winged helix-turn-helix transcriptional regulator n=1 Tax=Novosphingobium ginsenosidimutans TaxID=1176536 RepID=A0A5B8S1E6_9SPHN|nr:MarR family winged helix-turn-helix transcriptional regulator [Novosphingobium ginsenosidimutans]QEA14944.1 winged helix-turn-helix transcriptional regulator [Novosphingobium ginsenosidimutans]
MAKDSSRLADFLPYLMSVTTNAVSDMIAGEYRARFGLKIPEWRVMAVLGDAGAQTQRSLVGATRMDKVAVNRACKVLEDRGLVARSPNADDGRSHHIELTAAGKAMHGEIMPLALDMERRLFASLSAAELKDFKVLLARITNRVAELEGADPTKELSR